MSAPASTAPRALHRLCFGSGIVAALLYLGAAVLFVAAIVPQMPGLDAAAPARAAFYARMSRSAAYHAISYLGALQLLFLPPFLGGLCALLRRVERDGVAAGAVLAAGVALAVVTPLAILVEDHLLLGLAASGADPRVVTAFDGLVPLSFALGGFPQAVVAGSTSVVLRRAGAVPRGMGVLGLAAAVAGLAGTGTLVAGALFPVSQLASLLLRVWMLALCVTLLRRGRLAASATASPRPSAGSGSPARRPAPARRAAASPRSPAAT